MKKKIIRVLFLIVLILGLAVNSVNAEINKTYADDENTITVSTDEESDTGTLLGLLCVCIVTIARLIASVIAWMIGLLVGNVDNASFPWADQIIFNALPILDVNFINPAEGSLLELDGGLGIGDIVRNIYFTGLSIAAGFISIVIGVMSIRMALSTIASTKARYKESITTFLTALVLLFGLHYLLSFTFYLNEKLVEVASQIVVDLMNEASNSDGKLSTLGEWFYEDAVGDVNGLFSLSAAKPISSVLYCIFVVQSLMFLFAYFKRFFYVLILSIIGPFVVIYDFLVKAVS